MSIKTQEFFVKSPQENVNRRNILLNKTLPQISLDLIYGCLVIETPPLLF